MKVEIELTGKIITAPHRQYWVQLLRKDRKEALLGLIQTSTQRGFPPEAEGEEIYRFTFTGEIPPQKSQPVYSFSVPRSAIPYCLHGHLPQQKKGKRSSHE